MYFCIIRTFYLFEQYISTKKYTGENGIQLKNIIMRRYYFRIRTIELTDKNCSIFTVPSSIYPKK